MQQSRGGCLRTKHWERRDEGDCRENDIEADVCSYEQRQGTLGQIAKSVWQW